MREGEKLQVALGNFRVPLSMKREIQALAAARSTTDSEIIRQLLRLGLPILRAQP